jgi:hypothetical protein
MRGERDFGFSHVFSAFHSEEATIAGGGFLLARRIFGVQMQEYAMGINKDILAVESSGRNGRNAFVRRVTDPDEETHVKTIWAETA